MSGKLNFAVFTMLYGACALQAMSQVNINTLLERLDHTIQKQAIFDEVKKYKIESLKASVSRGKEFMDSSYLTYFELADQYRTYQCDSALHYARTGLRIAQLLDDERLVNNSLIQLAAIEARSGMFHESLQRLLGITELSLDRSQRITLYKVLSEALVYSIEYQFGSDNGPLVQQRERYQDSLLRRLETGSFDYAIQYGTRFIEVGELDRAERVLFPMFENTPGGTNEYALITSIIAYLYEKKDNRDKQKYYLALSAEADVQAAVKENLSLRKLALLLFEEGEIERPNHYIKKSLEDANFFNSRLRSFQAAQLLPVIDQAYQNDREKNRRKLKSLLLTVSVLSAILGIISVVVARQKRKLANANTQIERANNQLVILNRELQEANQQQRDTNLSLKEANHVKEQFIGRFLEICTEYIQKLDELKSYVARKIKAGQAQDLAHLVSAKKEGDTQELKELYSNFDQAFHRIYPTFVEEFNALLLENERYPLSADGTLNQELRIFALIKLGIRDTNKIAVFLHYSSRTVYNYRSRVRSKALPEIGDLEEKVREIGAVQF